MRVQVLKDFIGEPEEVKKYGNSRGIIPAYHTDRFGNIVGANVIELSEARSLKLTQLKIVGEAKAEAPAQSLAKAVTKPAPATAAVEK